MYTVFNYFAYAWLVVTYALTTLSSVQSSYRVGGVLSFALRWLALSVHTLTWTNWHYLSHQGWGLFFSQKLGENWVEIPVRATNDGFITEKMESGAVVIMKWSE